MAWYLSVLKKYATFSGRARRKEFWMFYLVQVLVVGALAVAFAITESAAVEWIQLIYILATLIPTIAVTVRRLHDTGSSGAWYFITFIPLIGPFWLLVLLTGSTQPEANKYGPNPKLA